MYAFPYRLPLLVATLAALVMTPGVAVAAPCGGAAGPCACGDTVINDHTLACGVDPVTTAVCPLGGLIVDPGVSLGLGNCTIRGTIPPTPEIRTGITLKPGLGSTDRTSVTSGRIDGFSEGVRAEGTSTTSVLRITRSKTTGVVLDGDDNILTKTIIKGLPAGVEVVSTAPAPATSDDNEISLNRIEDCVTGIDLATETSGTRIVRNLVYRSTAVGIHVDGIDTFLDRNQVKFGTVTGDGIIVDGNSHVAVRNISNSNRNGFLVNAPSSGSTFDKNVANYNEEFGFKDTSTGSGTDGTGNIYKNNRCVGNGVNGSPASICHR